MTQTEATINGISIDQIRIIKAVTVTDEWNRPFYKVRAYVMQTVDLKSFREKEDALVFLDDVAERVKNVDADHVVIVSEL